MCYMIKCCFSVEKTKGVVFLFNHSNYYGKLKRWPGIKTLVSSTNVHSFYFFKED